MLPPKHAQNFHGSPIKGKGHRKIKGDMQSNAQLLSRKQKASDGLRSFRSRFHPACKNTEIKMREKATSVILIYLQQKSYYILQWMSYFWHSSVAATAMPVTPTSARMTIPGGDGYVNGHLVELVQEWRAVLFGQCEFVLTDRKGCVALSVGTTAVTTRRGSVSYWRTYATPRARSFPVTVISPSSFRIISRWQPRGQLMQINWYLISSPPKVSG